MKYSILINQVRALEWGLTTSEAVVFSWIYELASWADKMIYDDKTYYFSSREKACEELPIVTEKSDTMYRLYKSLEKKGLVSIVTINKKDYIALTEKGKKWYYEDELPKEGKKSERRKKIRRNSEKNPKEGKKSEETRKKIRENSEKNPTYKYISNKTIIDYKFVLPQYKETFDEWLEYKKQRKEGYKTEKSLKLCYDKLVKLSGDCPIVAQQIVEQSMANNWAGLFELKKENQYGNNRTIYSKKQEANNYAFQQYLEEGERIARGERVYTSDPNSADNPF